MKTACGELPEIGAAIGNSGCDLVNARTIVYNLAYNLRASDVSPAAD